jgi:hypothetical protein
MFSRMKCNKRILIFSMFCTLSWKYDALKYISVVLIEISRQISHKNQNHVTQNPFITTCACKKKS